MKGSEKKTMEWGTRVGVILAVSGSAVGLGNFLRFPDQAAAHGGVAFMIPYILGEFAGNGMNLFFRNISETYPAGAVASAMFVSLSLAIKVNTLRTGTRPKTLLRFRKE